MANTIFLVLFVIFCAILVGCGVISKRWVRESSDYILAGREISTFINMIGVCAIGFAGTTIALAPGFTIQFGLTASWTWDGEMYGQWPGLDMQLLTLAFAAGEGGWLDYWNELGLTDTVGNAEAFSSLSRTDRGIRLDWDTQLEGDVIVADYFVVGEEDAVCSGRITFTIRPA